MADRSDQAADLWEQAQLFRLLVDSSIDPVVLVTADGRISDVSPALEDLLGYDPGDLLGTTVFDLIHPDDVEEAADRFATLTSGRRESMDIRARTADGRWAVLQTAAQALIDETGGVRLVVGIAHDVTHQHDSEQRFRELVDSLDAIVWEADARSLRFTFVSRAAEAVLGYPLEEWLTEGFWRDHLHPDDRAATVERCRAAVREGHDHKLGYRMVGAGGRVVWVEDAVRIVRDDDGAVRGLRGVMLDTTAREEARLELGRLEARYRELFDHATDLVVLADDRGRIMHANRAFEDVLGQRVDDLIGTPILDLADPADLPLAADSMRRKFAGEVERTTYELRARARDGTTVPLEVNSALVHDPDGTPRLLAIARDIRKRRALEDQLRQAQKLEAVGRLAGSVAHDFNNLLAAVTSLADLASQRIGEGPGRHEVDQIADVAERARALTGQLLAFGRRQLLRPQRLDVNQVISSLQDLLAHVVGQDIDLVIALDEDVAPVEADPGQLEQVLINLAVNARDATAAGGVVTVETSDRGADGVVLAVTDTGSGITPEDQQQLFEPFFTTKPDGSGLGLSTVHGIVTQSGGAISVASEPGRGTRFEIVLPGGEGRAAATVPPAAAGTRAAGASILLVEDEPTVREAMSDLLRSESHRVIEAATAAEALERWRADPCAVDVLVTDVAMPDMTGPELYAVLAAARPGLRAVLMSGYAPAGFDTPPDGTIFLQKPFRTEDLLAAVSEALAPP